MGELPEKAPARQGVMLCGPSFHKDVGFLFALVTGTEHNRLVVVVESAVFWGEGSV